MSEIEKIYEHIDANIDQHVSKIQEFLRQPSISQTGEGIQECATLLKRYIENLGFKKTQLVDMGYHDFGEEKVKGHPIVYGRYDAGAEKTLIIYMMYDCMPTYELEKWSVPPFDARLVEKKPFKKVVMARGATNSKGPHRAFLNACESIKAVAGELPVNMIFVAEGEEERLSVSVQKFVWKYQDELKEADAMFFPLCGQDMNGISRPHMGSEGLLYVELETSGKKWGRGPMEFSIHGARKRIVDSPAWRHVKMLSSMISEDGNKVLIDGWYNNVKPPSARDLMLLKENSKYYDIKEDKVQSGIKVFIDDVEDPFELKKRETFGTSLNMDGIYGGWTRPGAGAVLPTNVVSKHSIRIIPDQEPQEMFTKIRRHLDDHGFRDVEMKIHGGYTWCKGNSDTEIAKAAFRMYDKFSVKYLVTPPAVSADASPAWPCCVFGREPLKLPFIGAAVGYGARAHSPDEFYVIESDFEGRYGKIYGLEGTEKGFATVLYNYAGKT